MAFCTYILASDRNGTLYVGMTDDLNRRIFEHQSKAIPGFTAKYGNPGWRDLTLELEPN